MTRTRPWIAGLVAISAVLVSCTPSTSTPTQPPAPIESSAPTAEVAAADGLRPAQEAGPVPGGSSSGPAAPDVWPPSQLSASGLTVSPVPLLAPEGFDAEANLSFEIYDVSAGEAPGEGAPFAQGTERRAWQPPSLVDGRQYAWRVRESGGEWKGPWTIDVDTARPGLAPRDDHGGVSTHLVTGVPGITWMSRSFATVASSAFATLEFQPGRPGDPGLPEGWRIAAPLVSRWTTLQASRESTPTTVYIADARARSMTFRLNDSGVYVQSWSNGTPLKPADQPTLTYDGRFELTERDGTVTTFDQGYPVAVSDGGLLRGTATWSPEGLLESVTDPSDRTISFAYGGGACPQWEGFAGAPTGKLCRIQWWDGSRTDIGYVPIGETLQIGLIVDAVTDDFAGNSLGVGWDAAGRVSALRSAIVGAAAAADAGLRGQQDLLTQIAYDERGRVAAVTAPAGEPGAPRLAHVYEYPVITEREAAAGEQVIASVTAGTVTGPMSSAADVRPVSSALPGSADYRMVVKASDWTPVERQDRDGSSISLQWNDQTQRLEGMTDYEGRRTTFTYDGAGRRTGSIGPSRDEGSAYRSVASYDEAGDGERLRGMRATYWASKDFSGAQTSGGWVQAIPHAWDAAPLPGNAWSARLTGSWEVPTKGTWTFEPVASSGATLTMYVDNVLCDTSARSTCTLDLRDGRHQVRLDISVPDGGQASFDVRGAVDDERAETLTDVFPDFNVETSRESNDSLPRAADAIVRTSYDEPWTGNPTSLTAPGGLTTTATYERTVSAEDQWGRKLTGTTPGGLTTSTSYWPVKGVAEASPCDGSSPAVQAGRVRTVTRTDGVQVTTWYDAAGRTAAVLTGSQGSGDLACTTYAPDGTPLRTALVAAGSVVESSTLQIAVGGDPRVTTTTVEVTGTLVSGTRTARTQTDFLGRLVSYTDISGVTTTFGYDAFDRPILRAIADDKGVQLAKVERTFDDVTGRETSVKVNGDKVATISYDGRGLVERVDYGGGVAQRWGYAANGTVSATGIETDGREITDAVVANDAGRTIERTTAVTGEGETKRSWTFGYDDARRLTAAVLEVKGDLAGVGRKESTLTYGYDPQSGDCGGRYADPGSDLNRTAGSRNGIDYITCYDGAGRPVRTSDPFVAGEGTATLEWDGLGRLTKAASKTRELSIAWRWGGLPKSIVDGPVASDLDHALGRLVAQSSKDDSSTVQWRMAYSSPDATAPSVILSEGAPEVRVLLPGGALWRSGEAITIDHPGIRGEFIVRTDARGAVVPGAGGGVLAEALGPFGEPIAGGSRPGDPEYGYAFAQLQPTMPGPSGIVLKTARPYLPALGAFIAFDPHPGSSTTGYGYAEADPLNKSDPDGAYSWWDFGRDILAITSIAVSLAVPGAQWYTVLAISVLTSSTSLGITALERTANGETLTGSDLVFEGISVATDVLMLGIGEAAGAVSRKLSKSAKSVGQTLDEIDVKPMLEASNLEQAAKKPSWKSSFGYATAMVLGMRAMTGGFSSGQPPADQGGTGGGSDSGSCPFEGGCASIPDRNPQAAESLL